LAEPFWFSRKNAKLNGSVLSLRVIMSLVDVHGVDNLRTLLTNVNNHFAALVEFCHILH
jgi:hypothetical protein